MKRIAIVGLLCLCSGQVSRSNANAVINLFSRFDYTTVHWHWDDGTDRRKLYQYAWDYFPKVSITVPINDPFCLDVGLFYGEFHLRVKREYVSMFPLMQNHMEIQFVELPIRLRTERPVRSLVGFVDVGIDCRVVTASTIFSDSASWDAQSEVARGDVAVGGGIGVHYAIKRVRILVTGGISYSVTDFVREDWISGRYFSKEVSVGLGYALGS